MKTTLFSLSTLLILSVLFFLPSSFAQEYTEWALPAGATMRLGKGTINEMQFSPDGTLLAVASSIGVWLYDTETYQERALLTGHTNLVSCVCFSTDGRILASGSWDGTIKLWDVATGTLQRTLPLEGYVTGVRLSPDGRTLASSSGGGEMGWMIKLWDMATGTLQYTLTEPYDDLSMAFSPDGQTLASGDPHVVSLWDVATGTLQQTFDEHYAQGYRARVNNLRFSPDGKTLVSASQAATVSSNNKIYTIHLWDMATGEPLKRHTVGTVDTDSTSGLCWSPDGQTLAASLDSTIHLWDVATGESLKRLAGHTGSVSRLCWSPDGQTLASASQGYTILGTYGQTRASASQDGTIRLWNVVAGRPRHTFTGHTSHVSSLYWRVDGQTLVAGYDDGKVRLWHDDNKVQLWDVVSGRPRRTLYGDIEYDTSLSLSADGQLLANASDDTTIRLWDIATGTLRHTLTGHTSQVLRTCFSADGQLLASASLGTTIRLWDVNTGTSLKTLKNAPGDTVFVYSMEFSPDGQTLAGGGDEISSEGHVIRLWDVTRGTLLHTLTGHNGSILSLCFSPDGQTLASGNGANSWNEGDLGMTDYLIQLWHVTTGKLQKTLIGDFGAVSSLGWSPDGQTLASGGGNSHGDPPWTDYKVRVWDVATGELQRTLTGHTGEILNVRFSADGQTLASGSADGTVLLWEMNPDALPEKK